MYKRQGLDVEKAELYEKLPVKDEGMYNTIVTLTKTLNKDGLVPNEIRFNTRDTITLVFEDIKVNLGDDTDQMCIRDRSFPLERHPAVHPLRQAQPMLRHHRRMLMEM